MTSTKIILSLKRYEFKKNHLFNKSNSQCGNYMMARFYTLFMQWVREIIVFIL